MPINMIDADLAKAANCKHPHMRNDGYCPACGSTIVGYTPAPPVPTQPHDAAAADSALDAMIETYLKQPMAFSNNALGSWFERAARAYLASREEVGRLTLERDTYADALAGKCTTAKVNELLGQQTLCSSEDYRRMKAAERDHDALRKALLRGRAYIAAVSSATSATDTRSKVLAVIDAALARSAKP